MSKKEYILPKLSFPAVCTPLLCILVYICHMYEKMDCSTFYSAYYYCLLLTCSFCLPNTRTIIDYRTVYNPLSPLHFPYKKDKDGKQNFILRSLSQYNSCSCFEISISNYHIHYNISLFFFPSKILPKYSIIY